LLAPHSLFRALLPFSIRFVLRCKRFAGAVYSLCIRYAFASSIALNLLCVGQCLLHSVTSIYSLPHFSLSIAFSTQSHSLQHSGTATLRARLCLAVTSSCKTSLQQIATAPHCSLNPKVSELLHFAWCAVLISSVCVYILLLFCESLIADSVPSIRMYVVLHFALLCLTLRFNSRCISFRFPSRCISLRFTQRCIPFLVVLISRCALRIGQHSISFALRCVALLHFVPFRVAFRFALRCTQLCVAFA
jgi:hypothetical protein